MTTNSIPITATENGLWLQLHIHLGDKFLKSFPQGGYLTSKPCSLFLHFLDLFPHFLSLLL